MMKNYIEEFEIIKKDFKFENEKKDLIKLDFLNKISATPVWISKKTGLVFHNEPSSPQEIVEEWSSKIFSKKMDPSKHFYTDSIPEMRARYFYALKYLDDYIKIRNQKIFDFAFGQGGLLISSAKYFKCKNISGVEYSKENIKNLIKIFKKEKIKIPKLINSSIELLDLKEKTDIGFLTWTLCNCIDPLNIVNSLKKNIRKGGYLVVAESSRILVPFKKVIQNYFVSSKKIGHTHPWHWSLNSLLNIFKIFGFEAVQINRFYDVNDLVIIFKNNENFRQKIIFDDYKKVMSFLKRWKLESKNYKFN